MLRLQTQPLPIGTHCELLLASVQVSPQKLQFWLVPSGVSQPLPVIMSQSALPLGQ